MDTVLRMQCDRLVELTAEIIRLRHESEPGHDDFSYAQIRSYFFNSVMCRRLHDRLGELTPEDTGYVLPPGARVPKRERTPYYGVLVELMPKWEELVGGFVRRVRLSVGPVEQLPASIFSQEPETPIKQVAQATTDILNTQLLDDQIERGSSIGSDIDISNPNEADLGNEEIEDSAIREEIFDEMLPQLAVGEG